MKQRNYVLFCLAACVIGVVWGCEEKDQERGRRAVAPVPSSFDPATAGRVRGTVSWTGSVPAVPKLDGCSNPKTENGPRDRIVRANPNAPAASATGGVGNAVIFLRGVDTSRARPWDHAPVRVWQRDYRLTIRQGGFESPVGFVRAGNEIEMDSADHCFHALHAEGAAWFSLTFPDPFQPLRRPLNQKGVIGLSSGAGYYWMRAYLFVDDHPYYAKTDGEGRFELKDVPAGDYDLVCWMPNWLEERHERDPESSLIVRLHFRPPLEIQRRVSVRAAESTEESFLMSTALFGQKQSP